jgi:hypothetical protein
MTRVVRDQLSGGGIVRDTERRHLDTSCAVGHRPDLSGSGMEVRQQVDGGAGL